MLNPKVKINAREWLILEYSLLTFSNGNSSGTSVIAASSPEKAKYDEDLKEFLTPKLSKTEAMKTKKYGDKLKTYAQVLGITNQAPAKENKENKQLKKSKEKDLQSICKKNLQEEIKSLKNQVSMMNDLIKNICSVLIDNSDKKKEFL